MSLEDRSHLLPTTSPTHASVSLPSISFAPPLSDVPSRPFGTTGARNRLCATPRRGPPALPCVVRGGVQRARGRGGLARRWHAAGDRFASTVGGKII